ncbi:MAG TPA: CDP-diacylglycerol--glycerol-3-phosphate 3-phosphatidyltransferase [Ruminococcaceae bacterium]|nr:CDP-diacylglycerol--glycerol-3-phosphate 3-phosphatidyltransferase [Oscillospiraceae bacterium]
MNTPNKLTLLRVAMVPVFLILLLTDFPFHYLLALLAFIFAALTDLFDGRLARKNDQITDFGKFLDPLADKMLTTAAFLGFIELRVGYGIAYITMIVLTREFLVTSLRLIASGSGKVIAADFLGKLKTVCQMTAVIVSIFLLFLSDSGLLPLFLLPAAQIVCTVLLWISAVLTVWSGTDYLLKYRKYIDYKK